VLAEHGRPITHVKMVRACQDLGEGGLQSVLLATLRSPVQWVRDQALILIANPRPGFSSTSDLTTEMGIDLGTRSLPRRWPIYLGIAVSKKDARIWASLLLATLCGLGELLFLLAAAWGLFQAADLPWVKDQVWSPLLSRPEMLTPAAHLVFQGLVTLGAAAVGLWRRSGQLWAWILGSVPIGLLLTVIGCDLWQREQPKLEFLDAISPASLLAALAGVLLLTLMGVTAHLGSVAVFGISTRWWRNTDTATLLSLVWKDSGLGRVFEMVLALVLIGLLFLGATKTYDSADRLLHRLLEGKKNLPWMNLGVVIFFIYLLGSAFLKVISARKGKALRTLGSHLANIGCFILFCAVIGIVFFRAAAFIFQGFWRPGSIQEDPAPPVWSIPEPGPLGVIGFLLLGLGISVFFLIRSGRPTSQNERLSREAWKDAITKATARRQESILLDTHYQTLGLSPEEYLTLLVEIEPLITKEPALSTYWNCRSQLEQALRQEQQG
jgi:hypothetical protein